LLLADGPESICFDSEGFFVHSKDKKRKGEKFSRGQVVAVVLNLDTKSPNAHTVSLFVDGVRASDPMPLPEGLRGKELYPAVTYKNVSLEVSFGPQALRALPFKCCLLGEAATADCVVKKTVLGEKCEVVLPVGVPDEGTFDCVDHFLAKNRGYVELSNRAIVEWAVKSGVPRPPTSKQTSKDKPEALFGIPLLDDSSIHRVITAIAPALQRNYVIMEVKGNLLSDDRKVTLAHFANFKKTAMVAVGEPSAEHLTWVREALLKEKKEKAMLEAKRKRAEASRKKAIEEQRKKAEAARKRSAEAAKKMKEAKEKKDGDKGKDEDEAKAEEEEEKAEEEVAEAEQKEDDEAEAQEEGTVELTAEEEKLKFLPKATTDLSSKDLAASFTKFSIPQASEGFDKVSFLWENESKSQEYLVSWMQARKLTQRVDDLKPSRWFKGKWSEWTKMLNEWKRLHAELRDPKKREAVLKKRRQEKAKKEREARGEEEDEEKVDEPEEEMEIDIDDLDVFAVDDVSDIGNGKPLFSNFVYEDWALASLRFELHLLCHAFKRDLDDPERPAFHTQHLEFYYNKYFGKPLVLKNYGVPELKDLVDMVKDTVEIGKSSTLEAQLADDTPLDNFVKLSEDHRRDRQRRLDAGDESALLKFARAPPPGSRPGDKPPQRPVPQGRPGPGSRSAAYGGRPPSGPPSRYGSAPAPGRGSVPSFGGQKRSYPSTPGSVYGGPAKAPRSSSGALPSGYGSKATVGGSVYGTGAYGASAYSATPSSAYGGFRR